MIITSSNLNLTSSRQATNTVTREESLETRGDLRNLSERLQNGDSRLRVSAEASETTTLQRLNAFSAESSTRTDDVNGDNRRLDPPGQQLQRLMDGIDTVSISAEAQALQPSRRVGRAEEGMDNVTDTKLQTMILAVERLTGKRIQIFDAAELNRRRGDRAAFEAPQGQGQGQGPQRGEDFGFRYSFYEKRVESEDTSFQAKGLVKTADGQEIELDVELNMSRKFIQEQSIEVEMGEERLKDPLVVNFDGTAAELSATKFSFDIDSDGEQDQISLLSSNSAFLALDKNQDGIINDGSELFGAKSGNGFADLSAYDEDGNQWIDEADSIYSQLRVWSPDENGEGQLIALGDKDVGAIYLGNVSTMFDIKDDTTNEMHGQVASTSIFLKDSGGAGTVQQLNLVV